MAIETVNTQLLDGLLRHQVGLLRLSGEMRGHIYELLDRTEADMASQIKRRLAGVKGLNTPASVRRLQRLEKSLQATRLKAWSQVNKTWVKRLTEITRAEPATVDDIFKTVSPVEVNTTLPPVSKLDNLIRTRPFEGKVLKEWSQSIQRADISRITDQVRIGLVQGESSAAIARRVVGTVKLAGRDGVTEITRRQANALTRTAVSSFSNQARAAYSEANKQYFKEEVYVATLDHRTTTICGSLDGKRFPVGEGPIPPVHMQCRSLRSPVINGEVLGQRPARPHTERQLLREYTTKNGLKGTTSRGDLPRGHRGAFDKYSRGRIRELTGRVPAKVTYEEWLKRQSAEFQDSVLGKTKGELFRKGGLSLDKFVDSKGGAKTLSELRSLEKDAFKKAGLTLQQPRLQPQELKGQPYSATVNGVDVAGSGFRGRPTGGPSAEQFHEGAPDHRPLASLNDRTKNYFGNGYRNLNEGLRGRGEPPDYIKRAAAEINSEMKPLSRNYHAYRGDARLLNYRVGQVFDERGFGSWSTNPSTSLGFTDSRKKGTFFQVVMPKGQKAVFENPAEGEIVVPPGKKMRILEHHKNREIDIPGGDKKTVGNYYVVELLS